MTGEPYWHEPASAGYGQSGLALPDGQWPGGDGRCGFKVIHAG
jgi:hypothetical protein